MVRGKANRGGKNSNNNYQNNRNENNRYNTRSNSFNNFQQYQQPIFPNQPFNPQAFLPLNYQQYPQIDNQNYQNNDQNFQTPTNSRSDRKRVRQSNQTPPSAGSQNNANFSENNQQSSSASTTTRSNGSNQKIKLDVLLGGYDAYLKTNAEIKRFRLSVLRPPKEGFMCKGENGKFSKNTVDTSIYTIRSIMWFPEMKNFTYDSLTKDDDDFSVNKTAMTDLVKENRKTVLPKHVKK